MAPVLAALGLVSGDEQRRLYELERGRLLAIRAALAELDRMGQELAAPAALLIDVRADYRKQATAAEAEIDKASRMAHTSWDDERRAARRRLLLVEKEAIIESLRKGLIGDEAYERLMADVDARLLTSYFHDSHRWGHGAVAGHGLPSCPAGAAA